MTDERPTWFKSSYSDGEGGECLEAAFGSRLVRVRDSKTPRAPHLTLSPAAWSVFLGDVRSRTR
ncbi:DUF397 domain-containing protein [Streptomyces sp. NPDC090106]|uniref:DUF397 domain-containing protein n=1 Tax=Streptomyces sp. NPDC090106 TaxID=3365946 RepID=UPI0038241269